MKQRVVITGLGAVTPIGNSVADLLQSLKDGESGQNRITRFSQDDFPYTQACEVKGFNARDFRVHMMDPFIQYAIGATTEAIKDSGLSIEDIDPYKIGISVSSSKGGVHTLSQFQERFRRNPSAILGARIYSNMVPNFAAQWIARRWKIKGAAKNYVAACATGTVAVSEGARMVQEGQIDYCIAGASDGSVVPLMLAGYGQMKAMSKNHMRPFDQSRDGFLVGEGSGIVILESLESAQARKAKIYGEVIGFAYGADATDVIHFSESEGALSRTVSNLFDSTQLQAADIDYVNLHGTATKEGDIYEAREVKKIFGDSINNTSFSASKSMTGHMLGASGAVESIICLLAMEHSFIPPTIGLDEPDSEFDFDLTANQASSKQINTTLSWSMGFGGHVAAIAFKKL